MNGKLIDDHEVGKTSDGIVTPLLSTLRAKGSEQTGHDHDDIGNDGDENVGTAQACEEGKIQKQEWGGNTPVDITGPVYLTVDVLGGVGDVLVGFLDDSVVVCDTIT